MRCYGGNSQLSEVFGSDYASAYDALYAEKNYALECDVIEQVFSELAHRKVMTVLDLGCGTGGHALELAKRGYEMTGVDRSEGMLQQARRKASDAGLSIDFRKGDIRRVDTGNQYQAAISMFAVMGYLTENEDLQTALDSIKRSLLPGGIFMFDFWYGPAVLTQRPGDRVKIIPSENGKIIRVVSSALDSARHVCGVTYGLWELDGDRVLRETEETHDMRYFFPKELELFLESAGLELLMLSAFPDVARAADETTWNALAIAMVR